MNSAPLPEVRETTLTRDLFYAARYYLGGRRSLLLFAAAVLIPGLWFGWPALVAAGVAPILIALAPCAVMCALGLCMGRLGKTTTAGSPADADSVTSSGRLIEPEAQEAGLVDAGCAHCEDASEARTRPSATPQIPLPTQENKP